MTQVLAPADAQVKDFSERIDVRFKIDDDVFVGVTGIPALDLMRFGALWDGLSEADLAQQPDAFKQMFRLILDDASCDRFLARMEDRVHPISMTQVMNVLPWLMEKYGMRPTAPSSASSAGSENLGDGTRLTASASPLGLTSSNFPPTGS